MSVRSSASRTVVALLLGVGLVPGQDPVELDGRVTDTAGAPIDRARIELRWLEPHAGAVAGRTGRYGAAARRAFATIRPPRTISSSDGRWRMLVPPQDAAWLTIALSPLALSVTAEGHEPWVRAVHDPSALPAIAELPPIDPDDHLVVRLTGGRAPWHGFAIVERPFRVSPTRSTWLRERVELPADGVLRYAASPTVAGEVPPDGPTARVEGYRLTVWAADRDVVQLEMAPGEHELDVPPAPWHPRPVLGARAQPAPTPVTATWRVDGQEFTLELDRARVPLLGGEPPVAVLTPAGPVSVDAWDPDQPLFLAEAATEAEPQPPDDPPAPTGDLAVAVVDAAGAPVFGAAVLIEDAAAEDAAPDGAPFATSDGHGRAELRGIPLGDWRVLVHHPTAGEREALVTARGDAAEPLRVELAPARPRAAERTGMAGTARITFPPDADSEGFTEIGCLLPDGRVLRRRFPGHPGQILLEGLPPGPVTLFASRDDRPPVVVGGHLAGSRDNAPVAVEGTAARSWVLDVRDHEGRPCGAELVVSLVERPLQGRTPETAGLFEVAPTGEAGRVALTGRVIGGVWIRVRTPDGAEAVTALPSDGAGLVDVKLGAPPPPPDPPSPDEAPR